MIRVTEDDIGRAVIYRPPGLPPDEGVIVAFTERFVFVRYTGEQFSKATLYRDLEYSSVKT
jgi:hypothetical protein